MKKYNYDLATKIINYLIELDVLESASLGMHEDWCWTAQTIWAAGKWEREILTNEEAETMHEEFLIQRANGMSMFLEEKNEEGYWTSNPEYHKYDAYKIGGLVGSDWATPVIQVNLNDGSEKTFNCFTGDNDVDILEKVEKEINCTSGCLSRPIQEARLNINIEDFTG